MRATRMLDRRPPAPSPGALRARRKRWRRRHGLVPYRIDVDEIALAEALILSTRLTEAEALRPDLVARELQSLVNDFISTWRHGVTRR
jgi:hypothetical protein